MCLPLAILGICSGAIEMFFGHVENYAFGVLACTIFLITLYRFLEQKTSVLVLIVIYFFTFKAHIIAILFVPAVCVALAMEYLRKRSLAMSRSVLTMIVGGSLLCGIALYFFVFHSWNEPYALRTGRQFSTAFPTRFATLVSGLEPRNPGNDDELASMMSRLASYYAYINQGDSAIIWAKRATEANSHVGKYVMDLAAFYVQYDRLKEASRILEGLPEAPTERTNSDLAEICPNWVL